MEQVFAPLVLALALGLFMGVLAFPGAIDSPEQVAVKLGVLGPTPVRRILTSRHRFLSLLRHTAASAVAE